MVQARLRDDIEADCTCGPVERCLSRNVFLGTIVRDEDSMEDVSKIKSPLSPVTLASVSNQGARAPQVRENETAKVAPESSESGEAAVAKLTTSTQGAEEQATREKVDRIKGLVQSGGPGAYLKTVSSEDVASALVRDLFTI